VGATRWTPTAADVARMLALIGDTTGTEIDMVRGGPAPALEVTIEAVGGSLVAGELSDVAVRAVNRGAGTADRVAAPTRSSLPALHGQRLSFGRIAPGGEKTRRIRVRIPGHESHTHAMPLLA